MPLGRGHLARGSRDARGAPVSHLAAMAAQHDAARAQAAARRNAKRTGGTPTRSGARRPGAPWRVPRTGPTRHHPGPTCRSRQPVCARATKPPAAAVAVAGARSATSNAAEPVFAGATATSARPRAKARQLARAATAHATCRRRPKVPRGHRYTGRCTRNRCPIAVAARSRTHPTTDQPEPASLARLGSAAPAVGLG
jgi:hypothetical protein